MLLPRIVRQTLTAAGLLAVLGLGALVLQVQVHSEPPPKPEDRKSDGDRAAQSAKIREEAQKLQEQMHTLHEQIRQTEQRMRQLQQAAADVDGRPRLETGDRRDAGPRPDGQRSPQPPDGVRGPRPEGGPPEPMRRMAEMDRKLDQILQELASLRRDQHDQPGRRPQPPQGGDGDRKPPPPRAGEKDRRPPTPDQQDKKPQ